ncbi:MAG: hypothetical protein ACKVOE_01750 [Rickettsiales bacterium]
MSYWGWPKRAILNAVGLSHPALANGEGHAVGLAEGGVDPRTGGAVAIQTKAVLDKSGGVTHLKTLYWYMNAAGRQQSLELFDIELAQEEITVDKPDGTQTKVPSVVPRAAYVLGNPMYQSGNDGHLLGDDDDPDHRDAVMANLSRLMAAVKDVNLEMRAGKLPNVAKILDKYALKDASGHSLTVTGQSATQDGLVFDAMPGQEMPRDQTITVPEWVAGALMGLDANTIDHDNKLQPVTPLHGTHPETGEDYLTLIHATKGRNPSVRSQYSPSWDFETKPASALPGLTDVAWKSSDDASVVPENRTATLAEMNLCDENFKDDSHLRQMRGLGATNRMMHDARFGKYPAAIDHLVEHDLDDLVYTYTPPPPLAQGGRLSMISVGGNNMEPIVDGLGEAIGGNSKVVCHEGLDKNGKLDRVGVIIDLGLHLSPKDEATLSAAPDVVEHLKYCDDILITHRHLDHTDGLFIYIERGLLRGKTVHCTPEVYRSIRDKLSSYPGISERDLPTFAMLNGQGWLHIKDKQGKTRLSVNYARNATPHSARTTPFFVHGHYEGKWLGSYLNHGDARFGRHNADDYVGREVDADHLDKKFFTESNQRFLDEMQRLAKKNQLAQEVADRFDPEIAKRGPTYFDMDITSIMKNGWGPTEPEVEDNLCEISDWFKDKGMFLAMISTNDNRYETALRVGTRVHRDVTEFGTNLQKTATTMNVGGVNDLRIEPEIRNNILPYLDWYFEYRLRRKIEGHKAKLETTTNERTRRTIENKIERHEARLEFFEKLKDIKSPATRYEKRWEYEQVLKNKFGRKTTLGSLTEDELTLGAIRVGRGSKTARRIMSMDDGDGMHGADSRRLVLLTGTQGTNVEVDAALTAMSQGRHPVLNGNADKSHTARPVNPENNFVVISQSAIPGNDKKQAKMCDDLVAQGYSVVQAIHDGFIIHFAPHDLDRREKIEKRLKSLGKNCVRSEDGKTLVVSGMPIHAGGHGYAKDCEAWVNMVRADMTASQHTSSLEAGERVGEICAAGGHRYMGRIVPNFEKIGIAAGASAAETQITSLGRSMASLIRIQRIIKEGEYHGGYQIATRVRRMDAEGGFVGKGLFATAQKSGMYESALASMDAEYVARAHAERKASPPEPAPENRMAPPGERPDRGADLPGQENRGRLLGRFQNNSAAYAGR